MYCTRCGSPNSDDVRFCSRCGASADLLSPGQFPVASVAAVGPPFARGTPVRYAGFWRRFVASIIDALVFSPLLVIFVVFSGLSGLILHPDVDLDGMAGAMFGISIFAGVMVYVAGTWLYQTWMESSRHQATLGKMALGMIVTDMDGNRISFARANGRHFAKIVSGMVLNLGYLMAGFTEKKQALHDMMANCLVVMK